MNKIIIAITFFAIAQISSWFINNAQFFNKWVHDHPMLISIITSAPVTYLFIYATRYSAEYFDGQVWPGRFIGFGLGMMSFTLLTYIFLGESINMKTAVSLVLAATLLSIQIFWK
tara:strand:- start:601 stop:945 length:345 start_codon:yes stop_codon:yes gene_type:complete